MLRSGLGVCLPKERTMAGKFEVETEEPLNNSLMVLRSLQHAVARRGAQAMAVVLVKRRNAANACCSGRPAGLSGRHLLGVAPS